MEPNLNNRETVNLHQVMFDLHQEVHDLHHELYYLRENTKKLNKQYENSLKIFFFFSILIQFYCSFQNLLWIFVFFGIVVFIVLCSLVDLKFEEKAVNSIYQLERQNSR
jgi:hypothetical protein